MKAFTEFAPGTWVNPEHIVWIEDASGQAILHLSDGTAVITKERSAAQVVEAIGKLEFTLTLF